MLQILDGIHKNGYTHNDIKGENIMFVSPPQYNIVDNRINLLDNYDIKLIDFGLADKFGKF